MVYHNVQQKINLMGGIGHFEAYPIKHCLGIPRHTELMIAYESFIDYFLEFQFKIALGDCCKHPLSVGLPTEFSNLYTMVNIL